MTRYLIKEASAEGLKIVITIEAAPNEKTNICGKINIPCPDWYLKAVYPRPITSELLAAVVAKKLIGKEINLEGLFGQESKENWKRRLKKMGNWETRDCKFQIDFIETTKDENKMPYSQLFETIENIEGVDKLEELDMGSKKITLWRKKDAEILNIVKELEKVKCIGEIKLVKKLEVK